VGSSVLSVAYPLAPVGPDAVGGAEQIVSALDAALVRAGRRSVVLACAGSSAQGELIVSGAPAATLDARARADAVEHHRAAFAMLLRTRRFDLIHLHGLDFLEYLPPAGPPVVVTLHLPLDWYPARALAPARDDVQFVCVSESQRAARPAALARARTIENGVALDVFRPRGDKRDFVLSLGRICPEKGLHDALAAAHRAGVTLLHGGVAFGYPEHLAYQAERVAPWLDARRRLLGALPLPRKRRLLAAARCLLVTSRARETSSLVAMEALASGTPVVAFREGALPELIEHGRTGFLVDDVAQMADAIAAARGLNPDDCRRAAEQRFCARAMGRRYLALYDEVARAAPRRTSHAAIEIDELRALEDVARVAPEWSALCERAPHASVFQRPEWALPWCRTLLAGALRVVALRRAGRLVALAPLYVRERGGARVLSLIGGGVSDYLDVVVDPLHADAALRGLRGWMSAARGFDACELEGLRTNSVLLASRPPHGWLDATRVADVAPTLITGGAPAAFREAISPRFAAALRRAERRARAAGVVCDRAGAAEAGAYFEDLVHLHAARWGTRGASGVLADPAVQAFHRQVIAAFGGADAGSAGVRAWCVRRGAERLAVVYGFRDRGAVRLYLSGFDPRFSRESLGTLALAHAIESGLCEGAREVDFLRGAEAYKYHFGARDRLLYVRTLGRAARARELTRAPRAGAGA
jgi:CelD/BcsL family acetyltransferase involved in cellulose biosynthesis/glycosyltransferase involved in cell wall biosynthesis